MREQDTGFLIKVGISWQADVGRLITGFFVCQEHLPSLMALYFSHA
jgi:hypothetical protein